jgi:DNA-binding MarR family transcriptional regulator
MLRGVVNPRPLEFDPVAEVRRQWEVHRWPAPAATAAVVSIMRAQQIINTRADEALRPLDLTFARYEALALLSFSQQGALPLGKMGERLMLHPTSVTNIVDRLEQQQLVRRIPHPSDRRRTLAEITAEGRRITEKATEAMGAIGMGLRDLDEQTIEGITDLLRPLRIDAGDFPADGEGRIGFTTDGERGAGPAGTGEITGGGDGTG